jgi:hypothetical protein
MLTIYTTKGVKRFETPINKGSKRVFKLMGDDYVTLKFSVATPIYFKLGDYVDIPGFGRFELVKPYQPTYNRNTKGYDYELRLDAQHMKWRNKVMRYLPQIGGAECAWSLTATADVHLAQVLANIEALVTETLMNGDKVINQQYLYNGTTKWTVTIDNSVEASAKTISYDSTNIIDALTAIAEAFDCEWWLDGNIIHLGKCEDTGEYVDLEIGKNVAEMSRSDSSEDYVTRILAFGSDRNISPRYRKDLIFDVKAIANGGNRISDTARPLEVEWFNASMVETSSSDNTLKRVKNIKIEIIDSDGKATTTINGAIFNPDFQSGMVDKNWIQLPNGTVMQTGQRFRITNIIESKVKSSYFSSRYSDYDNISNVVRNGIVTSRLMLPVSHGTPYVDFKSGLSMQEGVEDVVIFEDIYPRAVCAITKIDTVQRKETVQNDDGTTTETTFTAYQIQDDFFTSAHPFQNDYIVPNETLKVVFQDGKRYKEGDNIPAGKKVGDLINPNSGKLNGWTFEVQFIKNKDGSATWEIVRDNENFVPNEILCPEIGDQFVLTGFDISVVDDLYVAEAEKELLEKATKYLEKLNTDPSTYDCTMMPDVMKAGLTLGLGKRINLINEAYIESTTDANGRKWGRKSRVIGYEIPLDIPYDNPIYTIGEKAAYSRFGEIEDKIDALKFSMTAGKNVLGGYIMGDSSTSSSDGIYVIKQTDITPASDTNVFSALRSCLEFTSKKAKEVINYLWTFMQGIRVGNYVMNNDGAKIDPNGDAEFGDVVIRKGLAVGENLNVDGTATVGDELTVKKGITIGDNYLPGAYGGRIWIDNLGKVHIETDYLEAREKIEAKEVEIQEETHVGGCQIISPAAMRCSRVIPIYNEANSVVAYKCFFTAEDETGTQIYNQFEVGDLAKCETFNLTKQPNGKMGNHYFWRKVIEVGYVNKGDADYDDDFGMEGYITLSNLVSEKDTASDAPLAGDRIITVGNDDPAKASRSNLIILASYGTGSPYIYQYKGINTFALTKDNLKVAISPNGNLFTGKFVIENGTEEVDIIDYIDDNIYLEAYQLVLSNEMAGVPCDVDGNIIGDLPSSKITIFKGRTIETGWTLTLEAVGCKASIVKDHVYLSELTSKNATVTITATKTDCPTLTKVMTICKLKEGETGVSGDHAVQFEIEPDKPMVLVDMDGNCDPATLGCKVYMVIGNQKRVEVPLANTAAITTYKAGDKLLFFNGRLFVSRPVEVDVPTDLVLRYIIVNQDYQTDETTGKVTPVITSETEHIYTGTPITTTKRMKHIIFKLYRGTTLLDMQTVIATTDASAMKVVYDTRFEVNEKEILAHASRISANEQAITDLKITADGISASIGKQSGIIQDIINGAGRNLLLKTNQGSTNWQYISDSQQLVNIDANPVNNPTPYQPINKRFHILTSPRTDSTYEVFLYALRPELIKAGEKYTLSFKIINKSAQFCHLEFFAQIANTDSQGALTDAPHFSNIVARGEQTLSVVLTASGTGATTGTQKIYIGIIAADLNQWTELEIWDLKLEKGETATAYSAAPEDSADYLYTTLNATINLTAEALRSEMTSKIGESEDRITSQHTSLIQQKADEILAQVEAWDDELGASISEIRQTATSISLKVDELVGYENLVTGNSTGIGWTVQDYSTGEYKAAEPDEDGYFVGCGTTSSRSLRTPLFNLQPNTKYILSFDHTRMSINTYGLAVSVLVGDTARTIATRTYMPYLGVEGVTVVREYIKFTTGANLEENAFVEFKHLGNKPNVAMSTTLHISKVILEVGEVAHPFVEDSTGLLATGIDITNRKIIFTSDNILFQTNSGERSMLIDENGKILAKFINVDELHVAHVIAGDENGEHVEIDPSQKAIYIYDANRELCTTINGQAHPGGTSEIYKEVEGGSINLNSSSGYKILNGSISFSADTSGVEKKTTQKIYSPVWQAEAAPIVEFSQGRIYCKAYAPGFYKKRTTGTANNYDKPISMEDSMPYTASTYVSVYLQVADDSNFTQNVKSFLIHSTGAGANSGAKAPTDIYDNQYWYAADLHDNIQGYSAGYSLMDNRRVKATQKGYCRIVMEITIRAKGQGSYGEVKWGSVHTGSKDLAAAWSGEFYVSNFFANGFCLGISKKQYVTAYKDANDNMHFEVEEADYGLKVSNDGIQVKHHGGSFMPMPLMVYRASVSYNSTSNTYGVNGSKSFDNNHPTFAKIGDNAGLVRITFPTSWQRLSLSEYNTIVHLEGWSRASKGLWRMKGSIRSISSTEIQVEISDDSTANDGDFTIEIYII